MINAECLEHYRVRPLYAVVIIIVIRVFCLTELANYREGRH